MKQYETTDELPPYVRKDIAPFIASVGHNVNALAKYFMGNKVIAFRGASLVCRSEPCDMYEDDGNTRAAGTVYHVVAFHYLNDPSGVPYQWHDYYHGHYQHCIVHFAELRYRDRDKRRDRSVYAGVSVGRHDNLKAQRIMYQNGSLDVTLRPSGLCDVAESIDVELRRMDMEKAFAAILEEAR